MASRQGVVVLVVVAGLLVLGVGVVGLAVFDGSATSEMTGDVGALADGLVSRTIVVHLTPFRHRRGPRQSRSPAVRLSTHAPNKKCELPDKYWR